MIVIGGGKVGLGIPSMLVARLCPGEGRANCRAEGMATEQGVCAMEKEGRESGSRRQAE